MRRLFSLFFFRRWKNRENATISSIYTLKFKLPVSVRGKIRFQDLSKISLNARAPALQSVSRLASAHKIVIPRA